MCDLFAGIYLPKRSQEHPKRRPCCTESQCEQARIRLIDISVFSTARARERVEDHHKGKGRLESRADENVELMPLALNSFATFGQRNQAG